MKSVTNVNTVKALYRSKKGHIMGAKGVSAYENANRIYLPFRTCA